MSDHHSPSRVFRDWMIPPTEWRYDGSPIDESEGTNLDLASERIRVRFGGALPLDVEFALNEAYREGVTQTRKEIAAEFEELAGQRNPALSDETNRIYRDVHDNVVDRIRHPERYSGCAAQTVDGNYANAEPVSESAS